MKKIQILSALVLLTFSVQSQAPTRDSFDYSHRFSLLAGLIQPIALRGGNVEVNYTTSRLIFDYSHGFNLNPPAMGTLKDQQVVLHLPFSTGFGIGYRITPELDIRFEPKLHSWEVYYDGDKQDPANRISSYKTFTLGAGVYYRYFPFRNSSSKFWQGITTASSVRCWPNVGSTLSRDELDYANKMTGKNETLKASGIGMGYTPFIVNCAVGYTFGGR